MTGQVANIAAVLRFVAMGTTALAIRPVKYASYLEAQATEIRAVRSAEKTRLRLLASLARLLERSDFPDVKVQQITGGAGVAKGTFFIYYKTKDVIIADLLRSYVDFERATTPDIVISEEAFDGLRQIVAWYEDSFAVNHGILRCLIRLSDEAAFYRDLWRERNRTLIDRWTPLAALRLGLDDSQMPVLRRMVRSAGAIMDQAMFERYGLASTDSHEDLDPEHAKEMHAVLMYRAIYGRNPPAEATTFMKHIISRS